MTFRELYKVNDMWEPETIIKIMDYNSLFIRLGFKCTPSESMKAEDIAYGKYGDAEVRHMKHNRVWLDFDKLGD